MNRFWTADWHLGHTNIIKYCNRPFKTIADNDQTILANCNDQAKEDDELYFLGDFCFGDPKKYLDQIRCKNIYFVKGSHDKLITKYNSKYEKFKYFGLMLITQIDGVDVVNTHCAQLVWHKSHYGSFSLYGHSHGTLGKLTENSNEYQKAVNLILSRAKSKDVGVDTNNFRLYHWDEIKSELDKKQGFLVDRRD